MKIFPLSGLILSISLLSACASAPPPQPRISDISTRTVKLPSVEPTTIDTTTALKTYRILLRDSGNGPTYREALRRLADVELENTEQAKPASPTHPSVQSVIRLYREYLTKYPGDGNNERILYQLAKAYDLSGQMEKSLATLEQLLHQYPTSSYAEEALFRTGEMYFSMGRHASAERAFKRIIRDYRDSLYFERSLYKLGWSLYLQSNFDGSLQTFFTLLDRKLDADSLAGDSLDANIPPADRELLDDSLKVICLALSYQGNSNPVDYNFDRHGARPYEALIYRRLGEFYLGKERFLDAAHTFMAMPRRHPDHLLAPQFHQYAIAAYKSGGFAKLYFEAKSTFVRDYGLSSAYWNTHDVDVRRRLRSYLAADIKDLAGHYHRIARHSRNPRDFTAAAHWYREYLRIFTSGKEAAEMNFMLAECLHDAGRYQAAIAEYERSAYQYAIHNNSAEAGYAALLTYKQVLAASPDNEHRQWHHRAIASALRFGRQFPEDSRVDSVLANTVDELYAMHDYAGTVDAAQRLLRRPARGKDELRRNVWIVLGHARFDTGNYKEAQLAYQTALSLLPGDAPQRPKVIENLAASMYKLGEQHRAAGDLGKAVALFLQIEKAAPATAIWATAKYDAAAVLIEQQDWSKAMAVLEDFRKRKLGNHKLQHGVTEKLALVYMKTGQKSKAAREMERLSASREDHGRHRELLWEAAALYQETGADNDAIRLYRQFIDEFPEAFSDGIEARHNLNILYNRLGKFDTARAWLNEIIKADRDAGAARTERSRQLAGEATLTIAQPLLNTFKKAGLTLPLKKSLKIKKAMMEKAIGMYKKALEYHVAEITTAATYQLAGIYDHFAKAILASTRPQGLSKDELEQYNILLEDQSYMFQEKAIQLYEANIKHIADGIYDKWIKDSLESLAVLYPVRYAKTEESEAFFDAAQ